MPSQFISNLSTRARAGLFSGIALIILGITAFAWWSMRVDYQVLFSHLASRDAVVMTNELERTKVPFKLADDGGTILVDGEQVHRLRLQLMSRDLGLQGAVGFELFNNSDVGMSEFSQRITYLRALQGELTRTIAALGEIETVRVHLALPEESLFKRQQQRPKAAITIGVKPGEKLVSEQVVGIQRLVAAAVPSVQEGDVTIVDQRGLALTKRAAKDVTEAESSERLEAKRDIEQLLSQKAIKVLERLLGPGQAVVSVDATINFDQVKTTAEEILPAKATSQAPATGVVIRERIVQRDVPSGGAHNAAQAQQHDLDFAVGRRIEQLNSPAGAIKRLQVAVVLAAHASQRQLDQARSLVAAAVGAQQERGDSIVVQVMQPTTEETIKPTNAAVLKPAAPAPNAAAARQTTPATTVRGTEATAMALAGVLVAAISLGLLFFVVRRSQATGSLNASQREELLQKLQAWLDADLNRSKA